MPEQDCTTIEAFESGRAKPVRVICPKCGGSGVPVKTITLKQMVLPEFLELAGKPGFHYCGARDCEVVYFHPDGERLRKRDLRVRIGLKEPQYPVTICYCFGFTEAMVVEEIQRTGNCDIARRIAAEVKAGHCACEVRNPQGCCCLGVVTSTVKRLQPGCTNPNSRRVDVMDRPVESGNEPKLRLLSLVAILGTGIFSVAEIVQPFYRSDRTLSDPYSTYVTGQYGFVQTIAFIVLSIGSFALSFGLSSFEKAEAGWRCGRMLLAAWAAGVLVAAVFPLTGGPLPTSANIHSLASMLSFLSMIASMLVLSKAFERCVEWRSYAFSSWLLALSSGGSFVLAAIIHHPICFAILQRVFLGTVVLWICMTSARIRKLADRVIK